MQPSNPNSESPLAPAANQQGFVFFQPQGDTKLHLLDDEKFQPLDDEGRRKFALFQLNM